VSAHLLDTAHLYRALDERRTAHGLNWRDVARETGLSPSTLTRLGDGHRPDADALCSLIMWPGLSLRMFVRVESERGPA
jgi:transcriptional regulator with XRE-family HTH domain